MSATSGRSSSSKLTPHGSRWGNIRPAIGSARPCVTTPKTNAVQSGPCGLKSKTNVTSRSTRDASSAGRSRRQIASTSTRGFCTQRLKERSRLRSRGAPGAAAAMHGNATLPAHSNPSTNVAKTRVRRGSIPTKRSVNCRCQVCNNRSRAVIRRLLFPGCQQIQCRKDAG